ncbi:MAG: hypothetical protein WDM70_05075 [Nitrosomonadales bacterium]
MTDDDLLKPGSIKRVLDKLDGAYDLVVVNAEIKNADFSGVLDERLIKLKRDQVYGVGTEEKAVSGNGARVIIYRVHCDQARSMVGPESPNVLWHLVCSCWSRLSTFAYGSGCTHSRPAHNNQIWECNVDGSRFGDLDG